MFSVRSVNWKALLFAGAPWRDAVGGSACFERFAVGRFDHVQHGKLPSHHRWIFSPFNRMRRRPASSTERSVSLWSSKTQVCSVAT